MGETCRTSSAFLMDFWRECPDSQEASEDKAVNNMIHKVFSNNSEVAGKTKNRRTAKQEIKEEKTNKSLRFKCTTCSQVFDSKIALSIHTGRIHKSETRDKSYQCKQCNKGFFNSSYLSQHMRIHTGQKPYACEQCDKRFTQLSHLQQHKRTHTGEKPYKCPHPDCSKAFSQLSNLQSHSRSHLPDGNIHKCTSCYKCYFDENSLAAHMMTHMESKRVRNYRCEICGKSYTQDTYLQNHIKNKHMEVGIGGVAPGPARNPTSIQAATSMVCKLEDESSRRQSTCGEGLLPPAASMLRSLPSMSESVYGDSNSYLESSYMLPYQHSSQMFDGSCYKTEQPMPVMVEQTAKVPVQEEVYQEGYFWRSIRSVPGYGSSSHLPPFPPQQQDYTQSSNGIQPAWLPYLMSDYHSEKSSMYEAAANDYLMGGNMRDALMMD